MKSKNSLYMRRTILVLICAVLILATLGLVMLYSSSMVDCPTAALYAEL